MTHQLLSMGVLALVSLSVGAARAQQPNIVLIMADDLGWSDTSNTLTNLNNPSDFYQTPALERLAAEGMAFTNAYTNGPNCAPTRSAILTGQYAQRPTNNVFNVNSLNRGGNGTLLVGPSQGLPSGTDAIPTNAFTYAELLQQAGYTTAHLGKFHVTETGTAGAALITSDHGFDENFGGTTAGAPGDYHASGGTFSGSIGPELDAFAQDYTQTYVDSNIKPYANGTSLAAIDALVGTGKHVSDALADAAIDFMNRNNANPFLVQFHPYAVHTPIGNTQARSDLLSKYNSLPPGSQDSNESFGALIEGLDQSVARLINYLETTPDPVNPGQTLDENTLVLFLSDNGGRLSQSNNGPLKGQKGELDEGGVRVPFIAWSGDTNLVDGGTVNHTPVMGIDLFRTFASLSGAAEPTRTPLDGTDLSGILADASADLGRDAVYWHFPGYLVDGARNQRPQSVIRSGDWKLLYNYEDQSYELYNLATDIGETTNLAAAETEIVTQLASKLMVWLQATDAPLATLRSGTLNLNVDGSYYSDGAIESLTGPLQISAGEEVPFVLGDFLIFADLNGDGVITTADWTMFRSGMGVDLTGLTPSEAFAQGDLDGDFDNDISDFILFKSSYELALGGGSFAALIGTPEPTATVMLFSVVAATCVARRSSRSAPFAV